MDVLIPPDIPIAEIEWRILDNTAVSTSPLNGVTTTFTRPGTRWGARLSFRDLKDRDRARLLAILAAVRGRSGRIYFTSAADPARTGGSSFPELFANADFSNGVTGWTTTLASLTVHDRVGRLTVSAPGSSPQFYQSGIPVTQYAPHALRSMILAGRGLDSVIVGPAITDAVGQDSSYQTTRGLVTVPRVMLSATSQSYPVVVAAANGYEAGHYVSVPFTSLARCALVDNGPNALLYSDQLDNAVWTKARSTVTANATAAPDGTTTADEIVEDSSAGSHYVLQSSARASAAEDCVAYGFFKRGSGTRDVRIFVISGVGTNAYCTFDLGAGTASAVGLNGSVTNGRAFIRAAGNGWYFCAVVARLPATTALDIEFDMLNAGSNNYTGDSTSSIYAWRVGVARSAVPTRGAQTVATALASGTTQTGSGLYLKGLPVSTQNIRAAGDMVEIILPTGSQLVRLTAALDSDAAGLGYLQFENPVRVSPADNAAVIFNQPMMRGILTEGPSWPTRPGLFSDFDIDLIEDIAP